MTPQMKDVERRFDAMVEDANEAFDYWRANPDATLTLTFSADEARTVLKALGEYLPNLGLTIGMTEQMIASVPEDKVPAEAGNSVASGYDVLDRGLRAAANIIAAWRATSDPVPDEVPVDWLFDATLSGDDVEGSDSDA